MHLQVFFIEIRCFYWFVMSRNIIMLDFLLLSKRKLYALYMKSYTCRSSRVILMGEEIASIFNILKTYACDPQFPLHSPLRWKMFLLFWRKRIGLAYEIVPMSFFTEFYVGGGDRLSDTEPPQLKLIPKATGASFLRRGTMEFPFES